MATYCMWMVFGWYSLLDTYIWDFDVWLCIDQRTNTIKTHVQKIFDHFFKLYTPHSTMNTIGRTYVFSFGINNHSLSNIISNQERFDFQSEIWWCFIIDLLMQHKCQCVDLMSRSCRHEKWTLSQWVSKHALSCNKLVWTCVVQAPSWPVAPMHIKQHPMLDLYHFFIPLGCLQWGFHYFL
jgi:hypothetical protein